jgi:hypothetical protein
MSETCPICEATFDGPAELANHQREAHPSFGEAPSAASIPQS